MTQRTRWQPAHPAGPRAAVALRRTGRRAGRQGCERGSVSLELAALAPVLLLLVLVTVAAMRITLAGGQVDGPPATPPGPRRLPAPPGWPPPQPSRAQHARWPVSSSRAAS